MTRNRYWIFALMLLCVCACRQMPVHDVPRGMVLKTFSCTADNAKTSLQSDLSVRWNASDRITVFAENGGTYTLDQSGLSEDGTVAWFSGLVPETGCLYAVYPAQEGSSFDGTVLHMEVPAGQQAVADGMADGAALAVALLDGSDQLAFRNVCGLLAFTVTGTDIQSMTLRAAEAAGGALSGPGTVSYAEDMPVGKGTGQESLLTLTGGLESGSTYYLAAWPGSYRQLQLTFTDTHGRTAVFDKDAVLTVERSALVRISPITVAESDWTGASEEKWELLADIGDLAEDDLVVIASRDKDVVAGDIDNAVMKPLAASFSEDKTEITQLPEDAIVLTMRREGTAWRMENAGGQYLGATTVKKLSWTAGTATWNISLDASGNTTVTNTMSGYGTLRYNDSSPRFTTYTSSTGKPVQLYRNTAGVRTSYVNTLPATGVTKSTARLAGLYRSVTTTPSALWFRYGTASTALTTQLAADAIPSGDKAEFGASLSGLPASTTYYYQAFATIDGVTYEGDVLSFTTSADSGTPGGMADYGWFELPAQTDKDHNRIDDKNPDYYYSHTFRADAASIRNFSACYSKSRVHPVWVAAPMHSCYKGSSGRNESYRNDPQIDCPQAAKWSGYTRGHMIGSSDRTISVATNKQVFYYSNIGAQLSSGFNTGGGAWNNLEDFTDGQWCADTLYQVVGCVFETWTDRYGTTVKPRTAGDSDIPTAWYKVLLRTKKGNSGKRVDQCTADDLKCAAFILTHRSNGGHEPNAQDMYSVSYLEELTGLTFFVNVPNAPKTTCVASEWGLKETAN